MNEYQIETIEQFHQIFRLFRGHPPIGWWFRGQSDISWDLLPKAGRKEFFLPSHRDIGRFNDWKEKAIAYSKEIPENDWECLAVAQHHGLATRLLDWTHNPLVAAFFSVNANYDTDGAIFCYEPSIFIDANVYPLKDTESEYIGAYRPRAVSPRILNQGGIFTVHSPADKQIEVSPHVIWKEHSNIARIKIPATFKHELSQHLNDYGVNEVLLFPDLDGLSKHKNWETLNMVKRKKV